MIEVLSPGAFYSTSLKMNGINVPPAENLAKVAAAQGVDIGVVKLAKAYFERLQRDGVPYQSEQARSADAMKMAQAYVNHVETRKTAAANIANGLANYLEKCAADFCVKNGIKLSPADAVKIAAMQKSASELDDPDALRWHEAIHEAPPQVVPEPVGSGGQWPANALIKNEYHSNGFYTDSAGTPIDSLPGYKAMHPKGVATSGGPGIFSRLGTGIGNAYGSAKNWVKANPWGAAGIGAGLAGAGLGAYYLMKKRNEEGEEDAA
jgi:hypothetical protein